MSKHFRVPVNLPTKLVELGVDVAAVLRGAGLPEELFKQPRVLVTTEEFFALWRGIGENSADPAIGLALGTEATAEKFDPIVLAALSSGTFSDAVETIAGYKQLSCPEEIVHESDGEGWSIHFRWLLAEEDEPEVLTDLCFAWMLSIARHGTGTRLTPLRVELERPRADAKTLERHFGCSIRTGAMRCDRLLLAMLAPQLDEALKEHRGQESFPERVRATIQKRLAGRRPKMHDVARELHISSRTLQRRLQDAGSSFQRVLGEARHQLARHYLSNSVLELTETAYLLGFEDANSFVRAFRSWEGVPPAHWRGLQRAKVVS